MPKIEISNAKGLVQKTGAGVVAVPNADLGLQTLDTNGDTINIRTTGGSDSFAVRISADDARTNIAIQSPEGGAKDKGRLLLLINETNATDHSGHTITFSQTGLGTLAVGASLLLVWTGTAWSPTSQSLS